MENNPDYIASIIIAVFGGIGVLVIGVIKFFVGKDEKKKQESEPQPLAQVHQLHPPQSNPGIEMSKLTAALQSLDKDIQELRKHAAEQAKSDAREGVLDAETRRLVADIASAMQALVSQIDRERVSQERDRNDIRQELRRISDSVAELRSEVRRRSSRPA